VKTSDVEAGAGGDLLGLFGPWTWSPIRWGFFNAATSAPVFTFISP
jgi:hypothetical protein